MTDPNLSSFIWSVADLLRGDYKQSEYDKVILPFPRAWMMLFIMAECQNGAIRRSNDESLNQQ